MKIFDRMIASAKQKGTWKRISFIMKSEWSQLDYIEVPNKKWYLNANGMELFEFDNGIFIAHAMEAKNAFNGFGIIKILPKGARAVEIERSEDIIFVTNPDSTAPDTWTKVTDPEEIESWLLRHNKRHLQQMYLEKYPPT